MKAPALTLDAAGPIVRIGPNEVHIQDPTFYETLYAQSRHSDKLEKLKHRFNNELSSFATVEHSVHRLRRGALNPFFSKRKIAQYSPSIQAHMDRLCERVAAEFCGRPDAVLNLTNMWGAFTSEIVVGYCLEEPYDFIMAPDFRADFSDAMYVCSLSLSPRRKTGCRVVAQERRLSLPRCKCGGTNQPPSTRCRQHDAR